MATRAELDGARSRLAGLAVRWRAEPWFAALTARAPGPVAHEVRALAEVFEAGDPGGAILQLRDTVETLVKFCTLAMAADLIANGSGADATAARAAVFRGAMSLGSWREAALALADRVRGISPEPGSRPIAACLGDKRLRSALQSFVQTRNDEIGHGAFSRDPTEAVDVIEAATFGTRNDVALTGKDRRDPVASIFAAFAGLEWPELSAERDGQWRDLQGADAIRAWHDTGQTHAFEARPLTTQLRFEGGRTLNLAPFVSARVCRRCLHQDVFLYDSLNDAARGKADFLDYVQGHKFRHADPGIVGHLEGLDLAAFEAVSTALDVGLWSKPAVEALQAASNAARYRSPDYLRDPLIATIGTSARSVTWLQAPAHVGKSVFARGIADPLADRPDPLPFDDLAVAGVFLKREWLENFDKVADKLIAQIMRALAIEEASRHLLPALSKTEGNRPGQFATLVGTALRRSGDPTVRRLLVVIDGLDELLPDESGQLVLDFIPRAEQLPEGVHLLLTSRRPGDPDCPAWIGQRLERRLAGGVTLRRLDLEDEGYVGLMRAYADEVLQGQELSPAAFDLALKKAEGLFLYFSFLVEEIEAGRVAPDDLGAQPVGAGLYARFLAEFKGRLGSRRLGAEAELILHALAAEELAHDWLVGTGQKLDHAGQPLEVTEPEWRGVLLRDLAARLDRDRRDDGSPEGFFLYAVYRLKAVIGVHRGGGGDARFRLWLKDLATTLGKDPEAAVSLRALHAELARRLLDQRAADPALLGHAFLSGNNDLIQEALTDEVVAIFIAAGNAAQAEARHHHAIHAYNSVLTVIAHRRSLGIAGGDPINEAGAYLNRANAMGDAFGQAGALPDYNAAIALMEALRDDVAAAGLAWPPQYRKDLAGAYMNRAVAKRQAIGPAAALPDCDAAIALMEALRVEFTAAGLPWAPEYQNVLAAAYIKRADARAQAIGSAVALPDYDAAIALREGLRDDLAAAGLEWPSEYRNDLAMAYANRAVASGEAFGEAAALPDHDAAIALMEALRDDLAAGFAWPRQYRSDLASAYMNRAVARDQAIRPAAALPDYDTAIGLMEELRAELTAAGLAWPPEYRNNLAAAYMNRAVARGGTLGREGALPDHDVAIALMEGLRNDLAAAGLDWPPEYRNDLAGAYMNRAVARARAISPAAALPDYHAAIALMERLRDDHAVAGLSWPPQHRSGLVAAYRNRAVCRVALGDYRGAASDLRTANVIRKLSKRGRARPWWRRLLRM